MSKEAMKLALEAAYLAGFNASGEGYNSEYPFGDHARNPEEDAAWIKDRDNALRKALADKPAQQEPVAWGVDWGRAGDQSCVSIIKRLPDGGIEVLATEYGPPASKPWVGLTDEQWQSIADTLGCIITRGQKDAIEAKLRERNT